MSAQSIDVGETSMTIKPLEGALFGAEITDLDPSNISERDAALILDTYKDRHGLICFSFDRLLEAPELHALTAVFGENEFAPGKINGIGKKAEPGEEHLTVDEQVATLEARGEDPYLAFIGNVNPTTLETRPVNAKFFGEWEWHSDMSYIEVPPTFSLLHARDIPEDGGDTGFCSQVMAAKALPDDLRQRVKGVEIKHDSTYGSSGIARPGMTAPASPIEAIGYPHPVLRTVPSTGDEAMFLGRRTNGYVLGITLDDSEALLDELWAHATQEQFCYRHKWKVGQVVAWDNRMMMHMRHPFDETKMRFMWRTQTKGEAVVSATT
ncbi:MAG: TauD/TfdA family dioxygenase [Chromatiales bacterium]|jgi:taurine dioxygenase|nr:TauD/TfdA family dioxygenase [Chromatiales bacterium]